MISIQNDTNTENLDNIFTTTLKTYKEGSRSRKQCATSLSVLAKFLEHKLPEDWKLMSKGYGLNKASFRDLPTDEIIENLWVQDTKQVLEICFSLLWLHMVLRNHEVFFFVYLSFLNRLWRQNH